MRFCPKCGGNDFRVRMPAVFAFDGERVVDETVRNDLNEDIEVDPDFDECIVICQSDRCDWQGQVCGLKSGDVKLTNRQYDVHIRVYVTARKAGAPLKRDVENKISELLLAMPRIVDGADWCVHATSLLGKDK